jgi:transcriptional regulator with XRE-family HTH domain
MVNSNKNSKEYTMRSRLHEFVRRKEIKEHRRITMKEIAAETGLSRQTISAWLSPEPFKFVSSHALQTIKIWSGAETIDELLEVVEINHDGDSSGEG